MKLQLGYTLEQLLEVYGKKVQVPEVLAKEEVTIYGLAFWTALRSKETWIDEEVEDYLGTELFFKDLRELERVWSERLGCNNYWLHLQCDDHNKIRLSFDMDMKDF